MNPERALAKLEMAFFDSNGRLRLPWKLSGYGRMELDEEDVNSLWEEIKKAVAGVRPMRHREDTLEAVADLGVSITYYYDALVDGTGSAERAKGPEFNKSVESFITHFKQRLDHVRNFFAAHYEQGVEKQTSGVGPTSNADFSDMDLRLSIDAGKAPPEEIAELLAELSRIYRKVGGSGITFRFEDATVREEEIA